MELSEKHYSFLSCEMGFLVENINNINKKDAMSLCMDIIVDEYYNECIEENYNPERESMANDIFEYIYNNT